MRDPQRIARIVEKLRQLWLSYPDQRLGQLVENVTSASRYHGSTFQVEDEEIEEALDLVLAGGWG